MLADNYQPERVDIGVQSFERIEKDTNNIVKDTLCLLEKFEDRHLKEKYDWNEDILKCLQDFLPSVTCDKQAYQITLDTHLSIAFAAGRILDSKSGINIFPIQKTATNGSVLWEAKCMNTHVYSDWVMDSEYRRQEEHGSAKWGNAKALNKKYWDNTSMVILEPKGESVRDMGRLLEQKGYA